MNSSNSSSLATGDQLPIKVSAKIGGTKVIDSGILISYEANDVEININSVNIKIKFLTDKSVHMSDNNMVIKPCPDDEKLTIIELYNIEQAFPEGSPNPLHVVNVGATRVFLSFFITTVNSNNGTRIFQYSVTAEC